MEYEQMETFLTVAKTKSFSRSAQLLHVAQTTISVRIQQLERNIGKKLFNRNTRNLELTESGKVLYPYVEKVLDLIQEGKRVMELTDRFTGRLIIGGLNSLWDQTFSIILSTYIKNHPEIALKFVNGHSNDIYSKIKDGAIDIGFVSSPPVNHHFETVSLYNESILLVKSTSYNLNMKEIHLSSYNQLPIIHMDWGTPFTEWLEQETGGMKSLGVEVDSSSLLVELLKAGTGIGFLQKSLAKEYIQSGEFEEVHYIMENPPPSKTIYLAYSKQKKDHVNIKHFATYMSKIFNN